MPTTTTQKTTDDFDHFRIQAITPSRGELFRGEVMDQEENPAPCTEREAVLLPQNQWPGRPARALSRCGLCLTKKRFRHRGHRGHRDFLYCVHSPACRSARAR